MVDRPAPPAPPPAVPLLPAAAHPDGRRENSSVRYEPRDVSFLGFLLVLVTAAFIAFFHYTMVWWFFGHYNAYESEIKESRFPLAPTPSGRLPPAPTLDELNRVERIESGNVYQRQEAAESILHSYGPAGEHGFAHVPIDVAMKAVAAKLSATAERQRAPKSNGLLDSGGPNSGRIFREGPP